MSHYTQVERKRRIDIVRDLLRNRNAVRVIVSYCTESFGCTRRKAIEYIAEATE